MITKYGFEFSEQSLEANKNRLTNQLWKLIPMRENEENWKGQLETVILEIAGIYEIFQNCELQFQVLLTKLEGLRTEETTFEWYRRTVFESISLLRGMRI